mgnify:CR=1 FL=1
MIEADDLDGHLILACKGWYNVKGVSMIDALGRIQAGFCGWSAAEHGVPKEALCDRLYKILNKYSKHEPVHLQEQLHRWMLNGWWIHSDTEMSDMDKLIYFYRSKIHDIKIKNDGNLLIKLPKPQKRAAKKLIAGKVPFELKLMDKLTS